MPMAKDSAWHDGESQPVGGLGSVRAQPVTSGAQWLYQKGELPLSTHALDAQRYVSQGRELFELELYPLSCPAFPLHALSKLLLFLLPL